MCKNSFNFHVWFFLNLFQMKYNLKCGHFRTDFEGSKKSGPGDSLLDFYFSLKLQTHTSVIVQRLGYLAFTQETRVRFPVTEFLSFFYYIERKRTSKKIIQEIHVRGFVKSKLAKKLYVLCVFIIFR